jgi:type 1 fimbria pilin
VMPRIFRSRNGFISHFYYLILSMMIAGGLLWQSTALASGIFSPTTRSILLPGTLSIPRDVAIGAVIYTSTKTTTSVTVDSSIDQNAAFVSSGIGSLVLGYSDVFQTSLPGIGIRWRGILQYPNGCSSGCAVTFTSAGTVGSAALISPGTAAQTQQVWYELVRVPGLLSGGQLTASATGRLAIACNGGSSCVFLASIPGAATVIVSACQTADVNVDMGPVPTSRFAGVGTKSNVKSFSINGINCPGGINSITYRLDPVTPIADASNSVIALDAGGASGVGLQLMDSFGNPVPLQQEIATTYVSGNGSFSIPLQAAYYQTGKISPGVANAAVSFTMTYQ